MASSSFARNNGVEVTHAERFAHGDTGELEGGEKLEGDSEFQERRKQNCKTNLNRVTQTRARAIRRPWQMTRICMHASTYLEWHSHRSHDTHYRSRVCSDDKVTHTHTHTHTHTSLESRVLRSPSNLKICLGVWMEALSLFFFP